jgi:hypothetical protein
MRTPCTINLKFFLLPVVVYAASLRHQAHPAEIHLQTNSSQMRMEDLIRNQQAISAAGRGRNIISDAMLESNGTPTSPHETQQVSMTSLLSGYYVTAVYMDDKCTTVMWAAAHELNACINYGKFFLKSAATADTESETEYTDILCAAKQSLSSYIDYTGTCAATFLKRSTMAFINSNGVPPSSLAMASIRYVQIIVLSCVIASLSFPCPFPLALPFILRPFRCLLTFSY